MTIKINIPLKVWDDKENNYIIERHILDWDDKKGTINGNERATSIILWACERYNGEQGGFMPYPYKITTPLKNKQEMALLLHKIAVPLPDELLLNFPEWLECQSQFLCHHTRQEIIKSGDKEALKEYDKLIGNFEY